MKAVLGLGMVGGGVFLLIALFNGTLHFPFGQFGLPLTSSNPNDNIATSQPGTGGSLTTGNGGQSPSLAKVGKPTNNKCGPGQILYNGNCYMGVGNPTK